MYFLEDIIMEQECRAARGRAICQPDCRLADGKVQKDCATCPHRAGAAGVGVCSTT